jgi:hypothetical protein
MHMQSILLAAAQPEQERTVHSELNMGNRLPSKKYLLFIPRILWHPYFGTQGGLLTH